MTQLTEKQAQLLLDPNFGSLAVLREDGSPEVTPVWVDWDGEYVIINTLRARAKPGRVERDPSVELAGPHREHTSQPLRIRSAAKASATDPEWPMCELS